MTARVYIGRLDYDVRERDLEKFFEGYGRIREILLKDGFGFVEFDDYRDADDAVYELDGKKLLGSRVAIQHARRTYRGSDTYSSHNRGYRNNPPPNRSYRQGGARGKYGPPTRTGFRVIVENLSSGVSWQDLKDYMRQAGEVTYADAHKLRQNEGAVEFASSADMKNAIDTLDDTKLNGRRIVVREDKSRSSRHSRSRSRSTSRRRSKSRSKSYSRSRSRSRSKSTSSANRDTATNRKKSRSESRSRSRTDSRSKSTSPINRDKSRSRSPTMNNGKESKIRSRSRSRSKTRSRSESISSANRDKSRSRSHTMNNGKESKIRNRSRSRSKTRSRSKSTSPRNCEKSRSRSKSRSTSRSRSKTRSRSKSTSPANRYKSRSRSSSTNNSRRSKTRSRSNSPMRIDNSP